jgi:hypothetical protein
MVVGEVKSIINYLFSLLLFSFDSSLGGLGGISSKKGLV